MRVVYDELVKNKQKLIKQRRLLEKIAYQYNIDGFNAEPFDYAIECLDVLADIYNDAISSMEFVYEDKRIN